MKYKVTLFSKKDSHEKQVEINADTRQAAEHDALFLGSGNWRLVPDPIHTRIAHQ